MYKTVSVSPRHHSVDLRNDDFRVLRGRECYVNADTEAAKSVRVRRCHLYHANVDRKISTLDQRLDLRQEDRHVVGATIIHSCANVATNKKRVVAEVTFHLRSDVVGSPERKQVNDFDILHVRSAGDQRFNERFGFGASRMDQNAHAGLHGFHCFPCGSHFAAVFVLPGHKGLVTANYPRGSATTVRASRARSYPSAA